MLRAAVLPALLLLLAGCEREPPMTRARAVVIADNVQRDEGLAWGDPVEVLVPGEADAAGRRWWQMRYRGGSDGSPRLIIVDADSGWGRMPPAGYQARIAPSRPANAPAEPPPALVEGQWILMVVAPAEVGAVREGELAREAMRLNALAGSTGLHPAFSLHHDRAGRTALVYGWQGDRGMAQDPRVLDWLRLRTPYTQAAWVDLLAP